MYDDDYGNFAIVYSEGSTRPPVPVTLPPASVIPLTENQWANGEITDTVTELWYSFDVEAGQGAQIWWNDAYIGDGSKTLRSYADAWYKNGEGTHELFLGAYGAFYAPQTTPGWMLSSAGTVYIKIRGMNDALGTFGIVYNKDAGDRPAVSGR